MTAGYDVSDGPARHGPGAPAPQEGRPAGSAHRRLVAHLDMDAFYASVELLRYPHLRGLPVVIGGHAQPPRQREDGSWVHSLLRDYAGRAVVTTATYEARAFGVHSAMGMMKAAALAPQAVLLPVDFDRYRHYSRLFKAAVAEIAPHIEDRGIDEIYIDLTEVPGAQEGTAQDPLAGARALGQRLRQRVFEQTGLSCSIGISPNKLLSKLCSELDKPGGLTVISESDIPRRIWPLPVRRVNGIGPKSSARLESLGVMTVGELAAADPHWLVQEFGASYGAWLHEAAHGRDERPVVTHSEPKSISRETTFERDLHPVRDRAELGAIFTRLCTRLSEDLQRKGYLGRSIGIKLRYDDFRTVTRDATLPESTRDAAAIRKAAGQCLKRVPLDRRLRLLGVRIGALTRPGQEQAEAARGRAPGNDPYTLPLFEDDPAA
ncbi:DNA polymerase IV [Orrella sp. JC864]|uniref:DNA polymerase IV n=1 Tax=Orrella sp. JC864 TaxID=3120298 RepID=UPI003007F9F7